MKMLLKTTVLAVSVLSMAGVVNAAVKGQWPDFSRIDQNNDGMIDKQEAASNQELGDKLQKADRNGDGQVTRAEFETARALNSNPEDDLGSSGMSSNPGTSGTSDMGGSQYPSSSSEPVSGGTVR